jgi:hypothetical protein
MVDKNVAKEGQLRVFGRNIARIRAEWRAEALQGGRCVELRYLVLGLLRDEFALEVWICFSINHAVLGLVQYVQCSCLPVKMDPSGGTDIMENLEYVVSARAKAAGRSALAALGSSKCGTEDCVAMLVGSV